MKRQLLPFGILLLTTFSTYGRGPSDIEDARQVADKFFQALTLLDQPEGKQMISSLIFKEDSDYPVISSFNVLFENLFDTDLTNVKGFKRIAMIQATSKAGTPIELRYVLISYKDLVDGQWKIFAFRKALDTSAEVSAAKSDIETPRSTDPRKLQYKYRSLAYWEIMDGKISSSLKNISKAKEEAEKDLDKEFTPNNLDILNKIIPQ
jgi:hypothetical protein